MSQAPNPQRPDAGAALRQRLQAIELERIIREAEIADLPRWAENYYPDRSEAPPNIAALRLSDADILALFSQPLSRRAHLALIDQAAIRRRVEADAALKDAVKAVWNRKE